MKNTPSTPPLETAATLFIRNRGRYSTDLHSCSDELSTAIVAGTATGEEINAQTRDRRLRRRR
ncbi:hypothetical protein YC2023_045922 [Brassica napus]